MKMKDMRKKSPQDLKKLIGEKEAELREFRFASAGAGKKNSNTPKTARKTIARAKTIINETKNDNQKGEA